MDSDVEYPTTSQCVKTMWLVFNLNKIQKLNPKKKDVECPGGFFYLGGVIVGILLGGGVFF